MAKKLGLPRTDILGRLVLVWRWASETTIDGTSKLGTRRKTALAEIDVIADSLNGFAASLCEVGWLSVNAEGSVVFPSFDSRIGSAKRVRELARARAEKARQRMRGGLSSPNVTLDSSVTIAQKNAPQAQAQAQAQAVEPRGEQEAANAAVVVAPKRRAATAPKLPMAELFAAWDTAWKLCRGEAYAFGKKDASALASAFRKAQGDLGLVRDRIDRLLENPPDEWHAANAAPWLLNSRWSQLATRVEKESAAQSKAKRAVQGLEIVDAL